MDFDNFEIRQKNVSYLHARDPSIIAWNKPGLEDVRVNLGRELMEETPPKQEETHVQVYLRIKSGIPFENLYTIQNKTLICKIPEGSHALRNVKDGDSVVKKYSFSKIFGPETTQIHVFNDIVKPKMLDFINGKNCTLLTYGASGSGKTFTIVGTDQEPGLIPRALEYIFRTIPQLQEDPIIKPLANGNVVKLNDTSAKEDRQNRYDLLNAHSALIDRQQHIRTYKAMQQRLSNEPAAILDDISDVSLGVWVSFAEIYNEHIYDLLQPEPARGKQRPKLRLGSSNGNTYVKNLKTVSVTSGMEAYLILQYGLHNLNYASTSINSHSSRSHSIFTIKLAQASESDGGVSVSHFNFCDLAGSERLKKTMNVGDRLKESNNINTSLLVLGRCISGVRNSQKQNNDRLVPFRESKLTQLFQKALSGFENIAMIVNMNPSREMFDESHHVLNFSAIAKDIIVEQQPKVIIKPKKNNRFSQYMEAKQNNHHRQQIKEEDSETEKLRCLVSQLYSEIEQQKLEFEQNEETNRNHIINGYKEILEETISMWEKKLESAVQNCKAEYEMKLSDMKNYYELLMRDSNKRAKVINLDDTDEQNTEELLNEIEELKKTTKEQQHTIKLLQQELTSVKFTTKMEADKLEKKLKVLTNENQMLKKKNIELEKEKIELAQTLEDAHVAYKEVEEFANINKEENEKLMSELMDLKERPGYVDDHKLISELMELREKVTDLEEQLSMRSQAFGDLHHTNSNCSDITDKAATLNKSNESGLDESSVVFNKENADPRLMSTTIESMNITKERCSNLGESNILIDIENTDRHLMDVTTETANKTHDSHSMNTTTTLS